jgi:hypothetical protein
MEKSSLIAATPISALRKEPITDLKVLNDMTQAYIDVVSYFCQGSLQRYLLPVFSSPLTFQNSKAINVVRGKPDLMGTAVPCMVCDSHSHPPPPADLIAFHFGAARARTS